MARKKTSTSGKDAKSKDTAKTPDAENKVEDATDDIEAFEDAIENHNAAEVTPADEAAEVETEVIEPEDPESDPEPETDAEIEPEEVAEDPEVPAPTPVERTVVERKGGFVPMLLGGLVAGGIGFGAAYYLLPQSGAEDAAAFRADTSAALTKQSDEIASLTESVNKLSDGPDLSGLDTELADMNAAMDSLITRLDGVESQFAALDTRLTDVEKRPITEGASDAAVAAYERELKALQDAMADQRAEIEAMAAEAQSLETSAEETAQATMRRAALTRIQTALDTGVGFSSALAELESSRGERTGGPVRCGRRWRAVSGAVAGELSRCGPGGPGGLATRGGGERRRKWFLGLSQDPAGHPLA